ncbi:hypothetical protein G6F57_017090 [Rhizopus arrhizus]|nr:hypothetical protein G6F57_017090 [Rhizopus arrhizus]
MSGHRRGNHGTSRSAGSQCRASPARWPTSLPGFRPGRSRASAPESRPSSPASAGCDAGSPTPPSSR